MAFRIDNVSLSAYVAKLGHGSDSNNLRIIGIRGAVPYQSASSQMISLNDDALDHWNDTIGLWGSAWMLNRGTVEPGLYWTENPENPNGAARLLTLEEGGEPYPFVFGMHKGQYPCLVQGGDFKISRDTNRDGKTDAGDATDCGQFGIHHHWGGSGWSVGKWSAGCQVQFGGGGPDSPWSAFFEACKASGQERFLYYLIDGAALARYEGLIP